MKKLRKKTINEFLGEVIKIHGKKYDYSLVVLNGYCNKIKIICPIHGIFEQYCCNHISGQGCPKCGIIELVKKLTLTTDEFVKKAKKIHGLEYDYSLVDYIHNSKKIKIICHIHGIFEQTPNSHLNGSGCPLCYGTHYKSNKDFFIKKSIDVHGKKYDYSLVRYKNNSTKIKIICLIHGIFEQAPIEHIHGQGCPKCCINFKLTQDVFIERSINIHGLKYDYSLVEYKNIKIPVKIICKNHGIFEQRPEIHLRGSGCPKCVNSFGENIILKWIEKNKIEYECQKKFDNFINPRTKRKLPFDFYLPIYNIAIEYDGIQHFQQIGWSKKKKDFKTIKHNDELKNKHCEINKIKLIRIPYWDFNNIERILNKKILGITNE